jgi:dienelactone hydrolase
MAIRGGLVALVLALAFGCAPKIQDLKPALTAGAAGTVWFSTVGSLDRSVDFRLTPGDPVVLSGDLGFPAGAGPFPAVVLMHGCGGLGNAEQGWIAPLRDGGYATFVVDSFGGRGLREVCSDARRLSAFQRIPDAYGALRILATHPRVDASRIALMGFSHGGILTLGAATAWAKRHYAPPGRPAFRAFVPFYPYCNASFPEVLEISAPLRIHTGELDDWTPAAPCRELVTALKSAGQDAEITVYPGAHHSFDNVGRPVTYLANVDNGATCRPRAASIVGPLLNLTELLGCLKKGATIGWSAAATAEARTIVLGQLAAVLR